MENSPTNKNQSFAKSGEKTSTEKKPISQDEKGRASNSRIVKKEKAKSVDKEEPKEL